MIYCNSYATIRYFLEKSRDLDYAPGVGVIAETSRASAYFGSAFTSLSHLASRRERSAEEPYLAKS